jgi:hypothetical protein
MFLKMRLEAGPTVPGTSRASGAPWLGSGGLVPRHGAPEARGVMPHVG